MRCACRFILILAAAAIPSACHSLSSLSQTPPEKARRLSAAQRVLARHFPVVSVDSWVGVVEARSVVGANPVAKYRTRAVAIVFPTPMGGYDTEIRVTNELEVSEVSPRGGGQPPSDWRAAGFDKPFEAQLLAELDAELGGQPLAAAPPRHSYSLWTPPAPGPPPPYPQELPRLPLPEVRPVPQEPAPVPAGPPVPLPPAAEPGAPKAQGAPAAVAGVGQLCQQYMALGDQCLARREYDKALLEYQRAAFASPESPVAHLCLAMVWTALDRYAPAAESLRQAADAARDRALPAQELARLRGLSPDAGRRLLLLKGWVEKNPADADARLVLGYHGLLADRSDEARQALQQVLHARPEEPAARYLMRLL
jgi:hypothetical protein